MDIPRPQQPRRARYFALAGGVALVAFAIAGVSSLRPALPAVERATLVVDSVKRGPMTREVRGPGTLVPENVRWISALTSARVERIAVQPGAEVAPDTVLIEMSNPDVQIEALQAEQALSEAQSRLAGLTVDLESARLSQRGAVDAMRAQHRAVARDAAAAESLVEQGLVSTIERDRRRGVADELAARLAAEDERLQLMTRSTDTQLSMQKRQIERLQAIAAFQRSRVDALVVRAGEAGVLQELALQPGQWVNGGTTMAKVVGPGKLKAVLRIPETQARDVTVGLAASIDTRNGIVAGRVARVDPAAQGGSVTVDVAFDEELPPGARPDLNVDGSIVVEHLEDVVFTGRPALGRDGSVVRLYRLDAGGATATLVEVQLGRTSTHAAQILAGLQPGDEIVLSDVALAGGADRIRLE